MITIAVLVLFTCVTAVEVPSPVTMGLSMIVKNEAHVIERSLNSIKPFIDYYVIVDTGSTDDTIAKIQRVMEGVKGEVISKPWVNFAHNRNEALDLLRPHATHAFFLDADDIVQVEGESLTKGLTLEDRAASVRVRYGALDYQRLAIVATQSAYRWAGVVHEVIHDPTGTERTDPPLLDHVTIKVVGGGARSKDPLKFQKDALVLQEYLAQVPNDTRTVFYIAQSYRDAGDTVKAIEWYEKRITLGGWKEEVFWSLYQIALLRNTDDAFARAARYASWRLEPIYHRARLARERGDYAMAFAMAHYCRKFLQNPAKLPMDTLFLDQDVFKYGCLFERSVASFWIHQFSQFKHDMTHLQEFGDQLPEPWRTHVQHNTQWLPSIGMQEKRPRPLPTETPALLPKSEL